MANNTSISEAAAAMGRIGGKSKSNRKIEAITKNLDKANKALDSEARKERARKAALSRWKKAKETNVKDE